MRYLSTRGGPGDRGFIDVLLGGLAPDGGLYLPQNVPRFTETELCALRGRPYGDVALEVIDRFAGGEIARETLRLRIEQAYAGFSHELIAPLVQSGPADFTLELFHGPTLAFKDVALQLLARLFDHVLAQRGEKLTIIGATSGDTGSAAIDAMRGLSSIEVIILHPEGRVSEVQRKQMTTAREANIHNLAIAGTFDDCQRIVKALFADRPFNERVKLSAINSINWVRILAQSVYYVTSALALGAPERRLSFVVPTGNFGDVYAGHIARRMGLPIERLVIATNENDILERTLATGRYEMRGVVKTSSPSMDIEVSSNFERLLFEAAGEDGSLIPSLMNSLAQSGAFAVPESALRRIREGFSAFRADEGEVKAAMEGAWRAQGRHIDPHTAVGIVALAKARRAGAIGAGEAAILLATAHPAKFPEAVKAATGVLPPVPDRLAAMLGREERCARSGADVAAVKEFILSRALPLGRSHGLQ